MKIIFILALNICFSQSILFIQDMYLDLFNQKKYVEAYNHLVSYEDRLLKHNADQFYTYKMFSLYSLKRYTECINYCEGKLFNEWEHRDLLFTITASSGIVDREVMYAYIFIALSSYRLANFKRAYELRDWLFKLFPENETVIEMMGVIK